MNLDPFFRHPVFLKSWTIMLLQTAGCETCLCSVPPLRVGFFRRSQRANHSQSPASVKPSYPLHPLPHQLTSRTSFTASTRPSLFLLSASCLPLQTPVSLDTIFTVTSQYVAKSDLSFASLDLSLEHPTCAVPSNILVPDPVHSAHSQIEAQHFNLSFLQLCRQSFPQRCCLETRRQLLPTVFYLFPVSFLVTLLSHLTLSSTHLNRLVHVPYRLFRIPLFVPSATWST